MVSRAQEEILCPAFALVVNGNFVLAGIEFVCFPVRLSFELQLNHLVPDFVMGHQNDLPACKLFGEKVENRHAILHVKAN